MSDLNPYMWNILIAMGAYDMRGYDYKIYWDDITNISQANFRCRSTLRLIVDLPTNPPKPVHYANE